MIAIAPQSVADKNPLEGHTLTSVFGTATSKLLCKSCMMAEICGWLAPELK